MLLFKFTILLILKIAEADLIANLIDDAKTFVNPLDRIFMRAFDKSCYLAKRFTRLQYDQLVASGKQPNVNDLTFLYIAPKHQESEINIKELNTTLQKYINTPKKYTIVFVFHGFIVNPRFGNVYDTVYAFSRKPDTIVLALDASPLIGFFYLRASTYVRFIGNAVGRSLAGLFATGLDPKNIYLVGHSLGAHIAGFAGKSFADTTGKLVGKITGLDPAGPCFVELHTGIRINRKNAEYVEIIHTNAGFYGLDENIGHIDYWVNGGRTQPGCMLESCSHNQAFEFFHEAVNYPHAFQARACDSWERFRANTCGKLSVSKMGLLSNGYGGHYLVTAREEPYGLGDKGLVYDKRKDSAVTKVKDKVMVPFRKISS